MAEAPGAPRIIPNWMLPPPPSTPMSVEDQEQLAMAAVAAGSAQDEASIIRFFSSTNPAILDTMLSGAFA